MTDRLRVGVLGAAAIAPTAIVRPARAVDGVELRAVAARDPARARRFASRHGIPVVHESYEALLADPSIDAVYIPLPNALHCRFTIAALEAGKHVLCEKPFASNADEARAMKDAADRTGLVLAEAFHWRYHPLAARMLEIVLGGELGAVRRIETALCFPLFDPRDIRYQWELAGGAAMDVGAYTVNILRTLAQDEPEVVAARARLRAPKVDRFMQADLRFADGRVGAMTCSLWSTQLLRISARVEGERGAMHVLNPVAPQYFHRLSWRNEKGRHVERLRGEPTYTGQLRAFLAAVRGEAAMPSDAQDAIRNMAVIDAVYAAAGLPRRGDPEPGPARDGA